MTTTPAQRLTRYLDEGRLIRLAWHEGPRGPDGYERACLRVAMYSDADSVGGAAACPDIPLWLAELMPWMDDAGTAEQWKPLMRRFAVAAHRWHVLDEAGWWRALLGSLAAIVTEARAHTSDTGVCDTVIALCREGAPADDLRWVAAEAAAIPGAGAAAAVRAARAARAAWTTTPTTAVRAATWTATWTAAAAATAAAWAEAEAEAADRIIAGIIDAIETECIR